MTKQNHLPTLEKNPLIPAAQPRSFSLISTALAVLAVFSFTVKAQSSLTYLQSLLPDGFTFAEGEQIQAQIFDEDKSSGIYQRGKPGSKFAEYPAAVKVQKANGRISELTSLDTLPSHSPVHFVIRDGRIQSATICPASAKVCATATRDACEKWRKAVQARNYADLLGKVQACMLPIGTLELYENSGVTKAALKSIASLNNKTHVLPDSDFNSFKVDFDAQEAKDVALSILPNVANVCAAIPFWDAGYLAVPHKASPQGSH